MQGVRTRSLHHAAAYGSQWQGSLWQGTLHGGGHRGCVCALVSGADQVCGVTQQCGAVVWRSGVAQWRQSVACQSITWCPMCELQEERHTTPWAEVTYGGGGGEEQHTIHHHTPVNWGLAQRSLSCNTAQHSTGQSRTAQCRCTQHGARCNTAQFTVFGASPTPSMLPPWAPPVQPAQTCARTPAVRRPPRSCWGRRKGDPQPPSPRSECGGWGGRAIV